MGGIEPETRYENDENDWLAVGAGIWEYRAIMTAVVEKITAEIAALPEKELDEFLSWLVEYELSHRDRWDEKIEDDSRPGGRLDGILNRVREDIAAGRTKPLDEVLDPS